MAFPPVLVSFIVFCCYLGWSSCAAAQTNQPQLLVSTQRLEELRANNQQLVLRLEMLSQQVETLKKPSAELVQELALCKAELNAVQGSLAETQKALTVSQASLKSAESSLKKMGESLASLEKQIQVERAKARAVERRLRWQRFLAYLVGGVAGCAVGAAFN